MPFASVGSLRRGGQGSVKFRFFTALSALVSDRKAPTARNLRLLKFHSCLRFSPISMAKGKKSPAICGVANYTHSQSDMSVRPEIGTQPQFRNPPQNET